MNMMHEKDTSPGRSSAPMYTTQAKRKRQIQIDACSTRYLYNTSQNCQEYQKPWKNLRHSRTQSQEGDDDWIAVCVRHGSGTEKK